jgi:hypothetical protein
VWNSLRLQVVSLGCAVTITHSTQIHTRFQLRIVVDQCQAAFSISLSYRKFKVFWLHQDTKQFSQGIMATCLYFNGTSSVVFYIE